MRKFRINQLYQIKALPQVYILSKDCYWFGYPVEQYYNMYLQKVDKDFNLKNEN